MKYYCSKCKTRITTHLWIVGETTYCSASCQRGGKSQFEKLWKALAAMGADARVDECYPKKRQYK